MNTKFVHSIGMTTLLLAVVIMLSACSPKANEAPDAMEPAMEDSMEKGGDAMMEGDKMEKDGEAMMEKEGEAMKIDEGEWGISTEDSSLGYSATRIAGSPHVGTVDISSGSLLVDADGNVTGEFEMDMNTITDSKGSEGYLKHIKSDDFFGVEAYPTSKMVLTSVKPIQGGLHEVKGNLTIKDQTHEIVFNAVASQDGDKLSVTARFQIDRTKWGITFDSGNFFQELGDRAIKDEIEYELDLVFQMNSGA